VKVDAAGQELSADIPSTRAATLPVGARVGATFPAESARVLALEEKPTSPATAAADR
jgi:hypothetical protein